MTLAESALDNLGVLGMTVLAVAGGAAVGAGLTALTVYLLCRWSFKGQPPKFVAKALNYLGGAAGALAVAMFIKVGGGTGYFFGSGTGEVGKGAAVKVATAVPADEKPKPADAAPAKVDDRVRVTVLGGALVKGRACYRLDGSADAVDLGKVKEFARGKAALAGVDILIYQNSLGYNTDPVKQLKAWATESGLTANLIELRGDIPP